MKTRKQYLNKECTHREYHAQFVNPQTIQTVERQIGVNIILNSTDEHMNDIPLKLWDNLHFPVSKKIMGEAGDYLTLAGKVCIAKEAARQIQERGTVS